MKRRWRAHQFESLPPPDARLVLPSEKIDTPVDERGLVIIQDLLHQVKATVDPSYEWPEELSIHHFLWPAAFYPEERGQSFMNPAKFRDIAPNKGLLPRTFENWLHIITLPPKRPEREVMRYQLESYHIAKALFAKARDTIETERLARRRQEVVRLNPGLIREGFDGQDVIGEEIMQTRLEKDFRGFERQLERYEQVPPEFRFVDLEADRKEIAKTLGGIIIPKAIPLFKAVAA